MSAFILKPQYLSCKLIRSQSPGAALLKLLADLVILAKHAAEITPAKKMVPEPLVPEIGGSSPKCRPAWEISMPEPTPQ